MNNKKDIVIIGLEEDWEIFGLGHRSVMLSKAIIRLSMLSKAIIRSEAVGKVVIINCPLSLPNRIIRRLKRHKRIEDIHPLILKKRGISIVKLNQKASMINLTALFPESDNIFSKIDRNFLVKKILWALKQLKLDNYILWTTQPRIVDIAKNIPAEIKLFDAIDNLLLHPQAKRFWSKIKHSYEWVDRNADLICVATNAQREMFKSNSKIFLLPNGVDSIFLEKKNHLAPHDIESIKRPLVGYLGVMQERIDIDLLKEVAELLPGYNFIFVGPILTPLYFKHLKKYSNVHFLGNKKYIDIPDYLNSFDVCIIPHKVNEFTISMDPLKIYEYLACGKPVVATPVAVAKDFEKYVYIAEDPKTFSDSIKKAISENNVFLESQRRNTASLHSWDRRINDLMSKISEVLKKKYEK